MEKIKNLYDGINYVTFPKIIIDELRKLSTERSSIPTRGEDAKMTKVYGDFINPMFMYFSQDNFYLNIDYYSDLIKKVESGVCFDENDNKIDGKNIFSFFEEYGKGFFKGYNDFESTLKSSNSLFNTSDEQISFKVYSRIKEHWTENKNGTIILNAGKIKNDNITFLFTEENFFKSGFNGGEFYKAWEIILNNPTIFEPIFEKNNDLKVENKFEQSEAKPEANENHNPYPLVFTSYKVYVCFLEYKKHIIDFYTDYSYLKKRLEKLKLIHYHTDNNFMKFLLNELNFISQSEFDEYSIKYESKLKSLTKSYSVSRYNNFDIVFNEFV